MSNAFKEFLRSAYPLYRPAVSALGLIQIMARVHGTDKHTHGYLPHYESHFRRLRHRKLKLFEIGVGGGGGDPGGRSLRTWRDYFPRAEIFGLDILDKRSVQEPRIKIFQGDQNDPAFLHDLASRWGPFDIIIDDGGHVSEHIITSFKALFPHVTARGCYVIEDLCFSYDPALGGSTDDLDSPHTSMGLLKSLVDDMHTKYIRGRQPCNYGAQITAISFYPKICFIQKGDNARRDAHVDSLYGHLPPCPPHPAPSHSG